MKRLALLLTLALAGSAQAAEQAWKVQSVTGTKTAVISTPEPYDCASPNKVPDQPVAFAGTVKADFTMKPGGGIGANRIFYDTAKKARGPKGSIDGKVDVKQTYTGTLRTVTDGSSCVVSEVPVTRSSAQTFDTEGLTIAKVGKEFRMLWPALHFDSFQEGGASVEFSALSTASFNIISKFPLRKWTGRRRITLTADLNFPPGLKFTQYGRLEQTAAISFKAKAVFVRTRLP